MTFVTSPDTEVVVECDKSLYLVKAYGKEFEACLVVGPYGDAWVTIIDENHDEVAEFQFNGDTGVTKETIKEIINRTLWLLMWPTYTAMHGKQ